VSNNNSEAVTYVKHEAGHDSSNLVWTTLNLNTTMESFEQLEIIRKFDISTVDDLVNEPPTAEELETLYTLPSSSPPVSPMFSLDEDNEKIVMSSSLPDFMWLDTLHHSRGADIQLPVYDPATDELIINRKTPSLFPEVVWIAGAKVTARSLNAANYQSISLIQELRSRVLNPLDLNYERGASLGTCPLDSNAVIPLKHIPSELGGQGEIAIDLSDKELIDLQDVYTSNKANGQILTWDSSIAPAGQWTNDFPLFNSVDVGSANDLDVFRWDGSDWELVPLPLKDLGDVTNDTETLGNLLAWDSSTNEWILSGYVAADDPAYPNRSDGQLLTWNINNDRWEAKAPPAFSYEVFDISNESIFTLTDVGFYCPPEGDCTTADDIVDGDVLAWFGGVTTGTFRAKSLDNWDLNNGYNGTDDSSVGPDSPLYSGGYKGPSLHNFYKDGWQLYWDNAIPQSDDTNLIRGSFHVGPPFQGGFVNTHTAQNQEVLKWELGNDKPLNDPDYIPDHWINGKLNLNHLGDVNAFEPDPGDIITWNASESEWQLTAGEAGGSTGDGYYKTHHEFTIAQNVGTDPDLPAIWSTVYVAPYDIRLHDWRLYTTTLSKLQLSLWRCEHSTWNQSGGDADWDRMDADLAQVVGWGMQGGPFSQQKKKSNAALNMVYTDLTEWQLFVLVLEHLEGDSGDIPTHVHFSVTWEIL